MLPTRRQWSKWSLPSKYGAWGLLVSILGTLISVWAIWEFNIQAEANAENRKFHSLLFQSVHELRSTREALCDLSGGLERIAVGLAYPELPVSRPKTTATVELATLYHDRITKLSYGEEKYILQLFLRLGDATRALEQALTWEAIVAFNHNGEMSVADVLFLASFLNWYLRPFAEDSLTNFEISTLGWQSFPGDDLYSVCKVDAQQIRFFRHDGQPMTSFGVYLGLID
jgi:hypothetical protein